MRILPAIDLMNGECVRLYQGDFSRSTQVANDPESQLRAFMDEGVEMVHIVDLDGARSGKPVQFELVKRLASTSVIPVEVGGGIRDLETIERYLDIGIARLVIGTKALEDKAFLQEVLRKYGDQLAIGVDAKNGKVATNGWGTVTDIDYLEFSREIESMGTKTIIFTDISKDGTMLGPNLLSYQKLKQTVTCQIIASGGIRHMKDIKALSEIGIAEAIVGKAVYEGKIKLGSIKL